MKIAEKQLLLTAFWGAYGCLQVVPRFWIKPVRERDEDGFAPHFWLERGIHDGTYEIDQSGRLVAMRFLMLGARENWVDWLEWENGHSVDEFLKSMRTC